MSCCLVLPRFCQVDTLSKKLLCSSRIMLASLHFRDYKENHSFDWDWHTLRRGAISLPLGTVCMCLVCKIPLALSFQYKMPKLMNWDAEVAKAAPAIPHPKPNIKNMSRPRFTKFDKIDARSGVLQILHFNISCRTGHFWVWHPSLKWKLWCKIFGEHAFSQIL